MHTAGLLLGGLAGCLDAEPKLSEIRSASTVGDYVDSSCSTAVVIGLSKQIAREANCAHPGSFETFQPGNGITFTSNAVLPFLEKSARDDLRAVGAQASLQINSALRTVVQQYLLYNWYLQGRCGITAAATPGRSNHEGGRAVDIENYQARISALAARGWSHDVPGDVVHFDHNASPDERGQDVVAFQRLWNRNHPDDRIAEDGAYGPQTESRIDKAPATGFAIGADCASSMDGADVVAVDGPDRVGSGQRAHYTYTLVDNTPVDWPATTQLVVASGQPSPLYDGQTWTSPTVVRTLAAAVQVGDQTTVEIDVQAPVVTADTPIDEELTLLDGTTTLGSLHLALTVAVDGGGTSTDGGDGDDEPGNGGGGCSAGGSAGSSLVLVALLGLRRRRQPGKL